MRKKLSNDGPSIFFFFFFFDAVDWLGGEFIASFRLSQFLHLPLNSDFFLFIYKHKSSTFFFLFSQNSFLPSFSKFTMLRSLITSAARPSTLRVVRPILTQATVSKHHRMLSFNPFLFINWFRVFIAWLRLPCWSTRGKFFYAGNIRLKQVLIPNLCIVP